MASPDRTNTLFTDVDANHDGKIDKNEFRNWVTGGDKRHQSSYETTSFGSGNIDYDRESAIRTSGPEETNRYLASVHDIYRDPNPRIVRKTGVESSLAYEQRISVKYLRPPTPPPPGPLIIREVRPPQPPPPPPLVIREQLAGASQPPPLILRERPPEPPASMTGETKIKTLPPVPVPPRSVIIERFQSAAPRPRDIVIERWLPYGPSRERHVKIEPAPPPMKYSEPSHTIILYEGGDARVNRKFEDLGVVREDPHSYLSRFGSSLLDSTTIVREARNAGVVEDITPPHTSIVTGSTTNAGRARGYSGNVEYIGDQNRQSYGSSGCVTSGRWNDDQTRDTEFTQYV